MATTQFFSLFGRHALFRVHLTIHDISNVPLVTGKFAVKWKFRNAHSSHSSLTNGKGREGAGADGTGASVDQSQNSSDSAEHGQATSAPRGYGKLARVSGRPSTPHRTNASLPAHESNPSKGRTSFRQISEHVVRWEQGLDIIVDAAVQKETTDLGPCELKLVVMQESVHGDVDRPKNPVFGVLYLNLSEYADPGLGPVTRRYLLREGKTNATLKLTIKLEHCGGEKIFRP